MVSMQVAAVLLALTGSGETVLLDFSADWCGPCRGMEPVVHQLQSAGYPVRKVNVDRERDLANRFHVQGIPCFVMIADGREVDREVGATSINRLQSMFAKAKSSAAVATRGQSPDSSLRRAAPPRESLAAAIPVQAENSTEPLAKNVCPLGPGVSPAQLLAASVRLTIEDPEGFSYGSGTIIDARQGEALVLTCGHIFRDSKGKGKISVDLCAPGAPQKLAGRLVSYDLKRDVGLISLRPGVQVTAAPLAPVGHRVNKGDKVYSVGCNNGGQATVQESHVTAIDKFLGPPNVQVAGQPVQGRSGGGLFSAEGLVIGVCNAADPADNEGLYAASATIQALLDDAKLSEIYRGVGGDTRLAAIAPPAMPEHMPKAKTSSEAAVPAATRAIAATSAEGSLQRLSSWEQASLASLDAADAEAEVICIVRPRGAGNAKSEVIVLDRASPAFLHRLAAERAPQDARQLTSLEVPRPAAAPAPAGQTAALRTPFPWRAN